MTIRTTPSPASSTGRKHPAGGNQILQRSSRNLALSTFVSRFLGFFREILTADIIGGGLLMSAWVLASTFANMCRRILGEGALGTALVPILAQSLETEGGKRAEERFSTVFIWLTFLLAAITLLVALPACLLAPHVSSPMWNLALRLTPIVMPYTIFICMVGIMGSFANALREFFLPSLTAILQNAVIIAALFFCCPLFADGKDKLSVLACAVLIAGVLEFLLMYAVLRWKKMRIRLEWKVFSDFSMLRETWKLAFYGIVGASALQASLLVDRTIASFLGEYAPAALYNSDRLVYLPIGIFAMAFGTVSLPEMSRAAARGDHSRMLGMMFFSLRNLLFITIPLAVFMFVFGEALIRLFFYRGAFGDAALQATTYAFSFYVLGIPSFAAMKITLMGFYARKDMRTPLQVSLFCIVLNVILNLILMWPLKQGGIALATVLSSLLNNLILLWILKKIFRQIPFRSTGLLCGKLAAFSILGVLPAYFCFEWMTGLLEKTFPSPASAAETELLKKLIDFGIHLIPLFCAGIVFGAVFLAAGLLFRLPETGNFLAHLPLPRRKKAKAFPEEKEEEYGERTQNPMPDKRQSNREDVSEEPGMKNQE